MSLAIVIINYRTPAVTIQCLQSLARQIDDIAGTRVFLIDNASGDDSVPLLQQAIESNRWRRWITFIPSPVNTGFAGGNNVGIQAIRVDGEKFRFVLLLNSDTIVGPEVLRYCAAGMQGDPKIGVMSCLLLNPDGTVQNAARKLPTPIRVAARNLALPWIFPRWFGWANLDDPDWDRRVETRDVGWVGGAFMLIRREVIDRLGGLDEKFFFYGEDVEFCHRAWKNGWKVRYDPGVSTVHLGGASSDPSRLAARQRDRLAWDARYLLQRQCYGAAAEVFIRAIDVFVFGFRYLKLSLAGRKNTPEFAAQRDVLAILLPKSFSLISHVGPQRRPEGTGKITHKRIAIALPGLHRVTRGAETAFEQIARELAALGHEVTVFGSGNAAANLPYKYRRIPCVPREVFEHWPKLPCLRTHYAWEEMTFAIGLFRQFRPRDFDVTIGCSYPYLNWILRRGGTEKPKHIFVTENGDYMVQATNAEFRFFSCDGLVCTNSQYFQRHHDRYPSVLIPNGVDPETFSPRVATRADYDLPENQRIVLMVSAMIPSKRVIEGVRAVARIPEVFLVVAGDGECREQIKAEADRLMPGRFRQMNLPREKMPELYRCADVFLHLSREEPSANAYMEALATGLPIVTHDWEVTRWTLEDQGIFVDGADSDAVTAGIVQGMSAKSPAQVAARRALIDRRFSWKSIAVGYSDFIEQLTSPATAGAETRIDPEAPTMLDDVGVVAIGRNEGDRLKLCLRSVAGQVAKIIYVDSGSTDGSVEFARSMGAEVVELDTRQPFNAARARNAGLNRLSQTLPALRYVQFVDGDCEIRPGWLRRARAELETREEIAVVCGRRRERFPRRNFFHRMIDLEWDTPVGIAKSCGGDAMMKAAAVLAAGSFNPTVTAGEEPELCLRLRQAGHKILRIDAEMTLHDANMTRIGQWWRREIRCGYGALDVATRFGKADGLFTDQVRSARVWGLAWPIGVIVFALAGLIVGLCRGNSIVPTVAIFTAIPILAWVWQWLKISLWSISRGRPMAISLAWAAFILVEKFAVVIGQLRWMRDQSAGRKAPLIEYKSAREVRT